jgi:hypothetical protein
MVTDICLERRKWVQAPASPLPVPIFFTDEELDFIMNYDIKYRMGSELDSGEGEE